ncbi:MAG: DUF3429 family protein [Halorhodospira sp.]
MAEEHTGQQRVGGAEPDPEQELRSATVVIFRSGVTDTRALVRTLHQHGIDFREVELSMGSEQMRSQFHRLQQMTGWRSLPQIFVHGAFVGGPDELFQHPILAGASPAGAAGPAPSAASVPAAGSHHGSQQGAGAGVGAAQAAETQAASDSPLPAGRLTGRFLGYAGLLPVLIGLGAAAVAPPDVYGQAVSATLIYSAVILSFLGGVHWGVALMRGRRASLTMLLGVLPVVLAWTGAWIGVIGAPGSGAVALAAGFAGWYGYEGAAAPGTSLPAWYRRLRGQLTVVVCIALLLLALFA